MCCLRGRLPRDERTRPPASATLNHVDPPSLKQRRGGTSTAASCLRQGGYRFWEPKVFSTDAFFLSLYFCTTRETVEFAGSATEIHRATDWMYRTRDTHGLALSAASRPTSPLIVRGAPEPHGDLSQNEDQARVSSSSGDRRSDPATAPRIAPKSDRILIPRNRRPTELRRVIAWIY